MPSSLPRRIAVAAIGIPVAIAVVLAGRWVLVGALQILAVLGVREVLGLASQRGIQGFPLWSYLAAAAAPAVAFLLARGGSLLPQALAYGAVAWVMGIMVAAVLRRPPNARPLAAVSVTVFAPLYAAVLPAFLLVIRHSRGEWSPWAATAVVFLPIVVIWVCDTAAMAGGALIGGRRLAPTISPNKTWAGTVSGSVVATAVAPLYGWLALKPAGIELEPERLALFGLLVSAVGQVGDLAESLFKREAGVKDSGAVFPGHGGVLDRLDSLFWALPTGAALLAGFGVL